MPEGPFYRELGDNIRAARIASGKSQSEIAAFLEVTFQQVQKYENGKNRMPVDRLVNLAAFLEVPFSQFVAPSRGDAAFQTLAAQFGAREFHALLNDWSAIKDVAMRAALLRVIRRAAALES